jgi:hypothetical protein
MRKEGVTMEEVVRELPKEEDKINEEAPSQAE